MRLPEVGHVAQYEKAQSVDECALAGFARREDHVQFGEIDFPVDRLDSLNAELHGLPPCVCWLPPVGDGVGAFVVSPRFSCLTRLLTIPIWQVLPAPYRYTGQVLLWRILPHVGPPILAAF